MAESYIVNIAEKILGQIKSLVLEEVAVAWNARAELEKLVGTVSSIRALLLDAEEQQSSRGDSAGGGNRQLRDWLRKLKDVCYDADDLLDEVEAEALRQQLVKGRRGLRSKVGHFFSCSNPIAVAAQMGPKIKDIRLRLDGIAADKARFHLTPEIQRLDLMKTTSSSPFLLNGGGGSGHKKKLMTHSHSFERPSNIIGRSSDQESIISSMLSFEGGGENVTVIPIVGIGGMGKTTLAKLAYNDDRVVRHFQLRMWVCVAEEGFHLSILAEKIIKLGSRGEKSGGGGELEMDQLQERVRGIVEGKRYLLVLDDVWNEHYGRWVELKNLLMDGAEGSKIMVTTRSHSVASIVGSGGGGVAPYLLGGLPHEDCVCLFRRWAFGERQQQEQERPHPRLLQIGNEIVNKCKGVPLALRTLGGLLYSKTDEREWVFVRDSELWRIEQNEEDGILAALKLSYDHLPSHLKHCFAYCAIFPKKCRINGDLLIRLWMAQGLIPVAASSQQYQHQQLEPEDVGMRYFKDLWSRSFFQEVEDSDFTLTCGMHDLVHDLALSVARADDQFCVVTSLATPSVVPKEVRHVSFANSDWCRMRAPPKPLLELKNLRTINFQFFDKGPSTSFVHACISAFRSLRVLDITGSHCEVLPPSIGDLKHLRYLDLTGNRSIRLLPSSITRLQSLQSLVLFGCEALEDLPRDMKSLISLRFFTVTTRQTLLPDKAIGGLSSLRCLSITGCRNLQSLGEGIQRLTALRTLCIIDCKSLVSLSASVITRLASLENLLIYSCPKLNLSSSSSSEEEEEVGVKRLKVLRIRELPLLVTLPRWLLPQPQPLGSQEGWSDTDCGGGGGRGGGSLEYLTIFGCPNFLELPKWVGDLSSLQKLRILNCPKVESLPDSIHRLTALRYLNIDKCPELSKRCAPPSGEDWHKISHVPLIYLDYRRL